MRNELMVASYRTLKGKHVVITGGAGFIGSHLVDLLETEDVKRLTIIDNFFLGTLSNLAEASRRMPDLRILYIDASNDRSLREAFSRLGAVDVVFDLAVIPFLTSMVRPQFCFETNVHITSALCELLREGRFETLVHFSSSEAYGSARTIPMHDEQTLVPLTPYAASKTSSGHLRLTYPSPFGLLPLHVRPLTIYF